MRIAQVSTLATPVRQHGSGSIESLVWLLAREFTRLGHEVSVFAAAGSETDGVTRVTLPGTYANNGAPDNWQFCEWMNICRAVEESQNFDVIHSHNYLFGMPLQTLSRAPLIHTTHLVPDEDAARVRSLYPASLVTGISNYQWRAYPQFPTTPVIYHGVDPTQFTFRPEPKDYVCYLGRFTAGKGPLVAINAAKKLGLDLVLAGPQNQYYETKIAPLVNGTTVIYAGSVTSTARDQLLGEARALLYPLTEPEPFGLIIVEAMMCGTPVAAINLGAVPEIIDEGITGYYATSEDDFCFAVTSAITLDRSQVRRQAFERFNGSRMAQEYLSLYENLTVE